MPNHTLIIQPCRDLVTAAVALGALAATLHAEVALLGTASISGSATDQSGLTEPIAPDLPHNRLGSFGSAIAYTGSGDRFIAVDDRGPGDGAFAFHDRFQTFDIKVDPTSTSVVRVELISTTMLTRADGVPFVGAATEADSTDWLKALRLDPEGVRLSLRGTLYVSDEYGPWIDEFAMDGRQIRRIIPPLRYFNSNADGDANNELPPKTDSGRQPNRGMEGLAISPDGTRLFGILQSPLIQDGALDSRNKRQGVNIRILEFSIADNTTREFVYVLDSPAHGVNELLAVNHHQLLVLERDGKGGTETQARGVHCIDLHEATDVSAIASLPAKGLPPGVQPVSKLLLLDFLDPRFGLAGDSMPEKIEGLAFGPDLPDGRHVLIVTTDNDFKADEPSWFWAFALEPTDLPGLVAQTIAADSR